MVAMAFLGWRPSCACFAVNFSGVGTRVGDDLYLRGQTAPRTPHASGSNVSRTGGFGTLRTPFLRSPRASETGSRRNPRIAPIRHKLPTPCRIYGPGHRPCPTGRTDCSRRGHSGRECRPEPPVDAVRNLPVVHPSDATRLVRQEWFDDQPFEIGRFTTAARHAALLFQTSEPAIPKGRYSFMRAQPSAVSH